MRKLKNLLVNVVPLFIAGVLISISSILYALNMCFKGLCDNLLYVSLAFLVLYELSYLAPTLKGVKWKLRELIWNIRRTVKKPGFLTTLALATIHAYLGILWARSFNEYVSDEVWYVSSARNVFKEFLGLNIGSYPYPQGHPGIETYLNLEHPPLGKYIIGLSIMLLGDKPMYWRIPGIIEASLMIVLAYFVSKKIFGSEVAATLASAILFLDPMVSSMRIVAMLDIHQAFFIALAFASALYGKYRLAGVFTGLAGSVKYSGFFIIPALILHMVYSRRKAWEILETTIILPIIVFALVNIPLILHYGFYGLLSYIVWAFKWHASYKNNPFIAPPWGWLYNIQPFVLKYGANGKPLLEAKTNPYIYPLILFTTVSSTYLYTRSRKEKLILPHVWFWSYYLMYFVLYIIGGRSQEIFYATSMSFFIAVCVSTTLFALIDYVFKRKIEYSIKPPEHRPPLF